MEMTTIRLLDITTVVVGKDLPRESFVVDELASSIRTVGMIEPLIVEHVRKQYLLVSGLRRLTAAKQAEVAQVPVRIAKFSNPAERVLVMLVDNLLREPLTPLEEAGLMHKLIEEHAQTQQQVADAIGKTQGHVSRRVSLLTLPEHAKSALRNNDIGIPEAYALVHLMRGAEQQQVDSDTLIDAALEALRSHRANPDAARALVRLLPHVDRVRDALNPDVFRRVEDGVEYHQQELERGEARTATVTQLPHNTSVVEIPSTGRLPEGTVRVSDLPPDVAARHNTTWSCSAVMVDGTGKLVQMCTNRFRHGGETKPLPVRRTTALDVEPWLLTATLNPHRPYRLTVDADLTDDQMLRLASQLRSKARHRQSS